MSEKRDKKIEETKLKGCRHCINYSTDKDECLLKCIKKCSKTDYSLCDEFLLHTKYTMF